MKKKLVGIVASDKMDKTRRVEVKRLFPHPKYGKIVSRRTVCHVHDENNESKMGDKVEIIESRPLSRTKRWRLVRIVEANVIPVSQHGDEQSVQAGLTETQETPPERQPEESGETPEQADS